MLAELEQHLNAGFSVLANSDYVDSKRLFHGRGHCHPGLEMVVVDLFDPVVYVTLFQPSDIEAELLNLIQRCVSGCGDRLQALLVQRRYLDGTPVEVLLGTVPEILYARRGELRFHLKLGESQNSGYFLDMEPGREWLEQRCADKKVLNLFSYTCAFSVVGVAAGAREVVNVDMSRGALNLGRDNHRLNDLPKASSRFLAEDIMKSWGRIKRPGPYDIAIIDPPTFQRGSFVSVKDYAKVIRRISQFMKKGGEILACLNAPELNVEFLQELFATESPECSFIGRVTPSSDFPDIDPERQLKLLQYRFEGETEVAEKD